MYYCRILTRDEITSVYNSYMKNDFPKDELKPLSMIVKALDNEQYFCYGIFNDDNLCGYAYFVSLIIGSKQYCLLDYFAVLSNMRDKGIGSEFLQLLHNKLKDIEMIICESEDPAGTTGDELDIRYRRIAFYLRNRFINTGVTASVFGVNYILLELDLDKEHTNDDIRTYYSKLYRSFLTENLYNKFVKVK